VQGGVFFSTFTLNFINNNPFTVFIRILSSPKTFLSNDRVSRPSSRRISRTLLSYMHLCRTHRRIQYPYTKIHRNGHVSNKNIVYAHCASPAGLLYSFRRITRTYIISYTRAYVEPNTLINTYMVHNKWRGFYFLV